MRPLLPIALTLLTACVSNGTNALPEDWGIELKSCGKTELKSEPEWIFLSCSVTNRSSTDKDVQFAPVIEPRDPYFDIPTIRSLRWLERRLARKNPTMQPYSGPIASSERPEAFIFGAIMGLLSHTFNSENRAVKLDGELPKTIAAGETQTFYFPLERRTEELPSDLTLRFVKPQPEKLKVPLGNDAAAKVRSRKSH